LPDQRAEPAARIDEPGQDEFLALIETLAARSPLPQRCRRLRAYVLVEIDGHPNVTVPLDR